MGESINGSKPEMGAFNGSESGARGPKDTRMHNILLVEDDPSLGEVLTYQLQQMGHKVEYVISGEEALAHLNRSPFDLVVLDWMLPGLSGVEIAQLIRKMDSLKDTAILMLTAKSEAQDIVAGLEAGADDYMTKPFDSKILMARVTSLLRRVQRGRAPEALAEAAPSPQAENRDDIALGPIRLSLKTYKAFLDHDELVLTPSEFKLLSTMIQQRGRVLTRGRLIEEVQGEGISVIGRTIDTHVFGLRKKLGQFSNLIETVRGVGYRVRDDLI